MNDPSIDAVENREPASESVDELLAGQKKRRTRLIAGGLLAVVALGGGLFALSALQTREANQEIASAYGGLARCLLGPPLAAGEVPSQRFRRIQLTATTLDDRQRNDDAGQSWPDRCATHAFKLQETLKAAGRAGKSDDLASFAETLGKRLKEPGAFAADLTAPIDAAFSVAALEGIAPAPAPNVSAPPAPATPYDADQLARATPLTAKAFSFKSIYTEPHAALDLRFLVDDPSSGEAPFLCTARRAAAEVRCGALPAAITASKQGVRLLGTSDDGAAPLIFAGNRGSEGVFRADGGALVDRLYSYGGYAKSDGSATVLGWKEKDDHLTITRSASPSAPGERSRLKPPFRVGNFYYSAQILWDQVMLRGVTASNDRRLFALAVGRAGEPLGAPVDVGDLPEPGLIEGGPDEPPHIAGCRTAEATTVRVKGYDNDFMTFRLGSGWTKPVTPAITGGTLSCSKTAAAITRVEPANSEAAWRTQVRHVVCTSAGCTGHVIKMEQLLHGHMEFAPRDLRVDAADLDGKLLVVWAAGERGGVRMRLAAPDEMKNAADVVIFDDLFKDGKVGTLSTFFDVRVLSREGFAVILLATSTGVHALRVDPNGTVAPMKVTKG